MTDLERLKAIALQELQRRPLLDASSSHVDQLHSTAILKAILRALSEPSEGTRAAAVHVSGSVLEDLDMRPSEVERVFTAMINHVLEESND